MAIGTAAHYDEVHEFWKEVMGDQFHFIYTNDRARILDPNVSSLSNYMLSTIDVTFETEDIIVDIGCGLGKMTRSLSAYFHRRALGISLNPKSIQEANRLYGNNNCEFMCGDFLNIPLEENVKIFWVQESSHLFRDKSALLSKISQHLAPGGRVVLCDLFLSENYTSIDVAEFKRIRKAFGPVAVAKASEYIRLLESNGLTLFHHHDITGDIQSTPEIWLRRAELSCSYDEALNANFKKACHSLKEAFAEGILTYQFIAAGRP